MDKVTQRQMLINYCQTHGSVTAREAFAMGINSPRKRISELRGAQGFTVDSEIIPVLDDQGKQVSRYARYRIQKV